MFDLRNAALADKIIGYSSKTQPGEKVMIELFGLNGIHLAQELVRSALEAGAVPFPVLRDMPIERMIRERGSREFWIDVRETADLPLMKQMDVYIGVRAGENIYEMSGVGKEQSKAFAD